MTPSDPMHLVIEGELSIFRASELRDTLMAALGRDCDVEVDLASVSEMDSAGVQLLMAAKKTASAAGRELRLVRHSPAVLEVFDTLDLARHFGDALLVSPDQR